MAEEYFGDELEAESLDTHYQLELARRDEHIEKLHERIEAQRYELRTRDNRDFRRKLAAKERDLKAAEERISELERERELLVSGQMSFEMPGSTTSTPKVYIWWKDDIALYVGKTNRRVDLRNGEHTRRGKSWVDEATSQTFESFNTTTEMDERERELIRQLKPIYNVQHNGDS